MEPMQHLVDVKPGFIPMDQSRGDHQLLDRVVGLLLGLRLLLNLNRYSALA
jgi:hypothetical protein